MPDTLNDGYRSAIVQQMPTPTNVISNPGKAVEAPNAETSLVKNADGSVVGRMTGSSVVFNLPSPKTT
jgi:hypothetical protein